MYPPTPCHTKLLQASSLESPQPFLLHPVHLATLLSADLDSTKLSILSGATFTTPTPLPSLFFPLFTDRYIACRPVRRYHTVHPRSTHIPTPHPAFPLRETTTGPTSWFFTERRGKRVTVYIVVIFLNGFRRIDLRRLHVPSWSRADVTRRQDHFRRRFFPR